MSAVETPAPVVDLEADYEHLVVVGDARAPEGMRCAEDACENVQNEMASVPGPFRNNELVLEGKASRLLR